MHVLATDMDTEGAERRGWSRTNQHASSREQLFRADLISKEAFDARVTYRTMDMNAVPTSLYGSFDFVWSTCSLEHVGSIAQGKLFAVTSMLLLKPGGVAVHTTEFTLSSLTSTVETGPTVLWRRSDVEELRAHLNATGYDVSGSCFATGTGPLDAEVDLPPYHNFKHIKLRLGSHVATSVAWTARRVLNNK